MNRLNYLIGKLPKVLLVVILINGCTQNIKINQPPPFDIQISGPVSNDTILREGRYKEIVQKLNAKILNNKKLDTFNFGAYDEKNDQIIPYAIFYTKRVNDSLNKISIRDIWKPKQCKIPPNSFIEKKISINFHPEYDTVHFEFIFSVGEEQEMPVRVSYLIQNGKLKKRTSMKFRKN